MIDSRLHRRRRSLLLVRKLLVRRDQQAQRATVRTDQSIVTPLLDHHVLQHRMNHHRNSIPGVVRSHHRARTAFFKSHAERHGVVFAKKPIIEIRRRMRASVLVLIRQEMLHQRRRLPVLRIRSLQPLSKRHRQRSHQIGILAERLFRPSPARIAAQIRIRRPHHNSAAIENRILVEVARLVSLRATPIFFRQIWIPRRAQSLLLRKCRRRRRLSSPRCPIRRPAQRQPMQPFHLSRKNDPQPRKLRMVRHQLNLFIERQPPQQVLNARAVRERCVSKRIVSLCPRYRRHTRHQHQPQHPKHTPATR